jgi:hypothetical protein
VSEKENPVADQKLLRDKMRQMIFDSKLISIQEKGMLIHLMHDEAMRTVMTEILTDAGAHPRRIHNLECMKVIADIIRFVLTLFVHEGNPNYKLMAAILDCSQSLFYQNNMRKQTISFYLLDHGIWSDTGAWRECIDSTLKQRMHDTNERLKRRGQRSTSNSRPSNEREKEGLFSNKNKGLGVGATAFKKGFGKIKNLM